MSKPFYLFIKVLHSIADSININVKIWEMYFKNLLPRLVKEGDDGNFGSTAVCDTICLQVCVIKLCLIRASLRLGTGNYIAFRGYSC